MKRFPLNWYEILTTYILVIDSVLTIHRCSVYTHVVRWSYIYGSIHAVSGR